MVECGLLVLMHLGIPGYVTALIADRCLETVSRSKLCACAKLATDERNYLNVKQYDLKVV
jgi:hypothetical protein